MKQVKNRKNMRRLWIPLMLLSLLAALLLPALSLAETRGTMREDWAVQTGPGDKYVQLPRVTLREGAQVTVRTQYRNGSQTWLQVEFSQGGRPVRGYVPEEAVSASLWDVPVEAPLCAGVVSATAPCAAPAGLAWDGVIRQDSSAIVYEVEDGWVHIEYWSYDQVKKARAWVPLTAVKAEMAFGFTGYYGVADDVSLLVPAPTRAPSTYYGATQGYPVGKMCTVVSGSCHLKEYAGEDWKTVGYAYVGERYEVLDCRTGSTGKDWYLVKQGSVYGWISSGLVSLD